MTDRDGVSYCPARVDLLSNIQFSNFSNIQYLQVQHSDEEFGQYVEGSETEEDDAYEDIAELQPTEEDSLDDTSSPIPTSVEGNEPNITEDRQTQSAPPAEPEKPEAEETEPVKPASSAHRKKAKNLRKKEESKRKVSKKKGVSSKTKESKKKDTSKTMKPKVEEGESKDVPKDAEVPAKATEKSPTQEPPSPAESPPVNDKPRESPQAATDQATARPNEYESAESLSQPEPAARVQGENEETKGNTPTGSHEIPETSETSSTPVVEPPREEASFGAEPESVQEPGSATLNTLKSEVSGDEPSETATDEPAKDSDSSDNAPDAEPSNSNGSTDKQPAPEASPMPEDKVDNGIVAEASGGVATDEAMDTTTGPDVVKPAQAPEAMKESAEAEPQSVPKTEEQRETVTRESPSPTEEPESVIGTSLAEDSPKDDNTNQTSDQAPSEEAPALEAETIANEEKYEVDAPDEDQSNLTAEEPKVKGVDAEPTQASVEPETTSPIEKKDERELPSKKSTEANESPELAEAEASVDDENKETPKQESASILEQSTTETQQAPATVDMETSKELTTPEESAKSEAPNKVPANPSGDNSAGDTQVNEPPSAKETKENAEDRPVTLVEEPETQDTPEAEAPETQGETSNDSASNVNQQGEQTSDSVVETNPENAEPAKESTPQMNDNKAQPSDEITGDDQQEATGQEATNAAAEPISSGEGDTDKPPAREHAADPISTEDPVDKEKSSELQGDFDPNTEVLDATPEEHVESTDHPGSELNTGRAKGELESPQEGITDSGVTGRQGEDSNEPETASEPKPNSSDDQAKTEEDAGNITTEAPEASESTIEEESPVASLPSDSDGTKLEESSPTDGNASKDANSDAHGNKPAVADSHPSEDDASNDTGEVDDQPGNESAIAETVSNKEDQGDTNTGGNQKPSEPEKIEAGTENEEQEPSGPADDKTTPPALEGLSTESIEEETPGDDIESKKNGTSEECLKVPTESDGITKDETTTEEVGGNSSPAAADQSSKDGQTVIESSSIPPDTTITTDARDDDIEPTQLLSTEASDVSTQGPAKSGDGDTDNGEAKAIGQAEEVVGGENEPQSQALIESSPTTPIEAQEPAEAEGAKEPKETLDQHAPSPESDAQPQAQNPTTENESGYNGEANGGTEEVSADVDEGSEGPPAKENDSIEDSLVEVETPSGSKDSSEERNTSAPEPEATVKEISKEETSAAQQTLAVQGEASTEETLGEEKAPTPEDVSGSGNAPVAEEEMIQEEPTSEDKSVTDTIPDPQDGPTVEEISVAETSPDNGSPIAEQVSPIQAPTTEEAPGMDVLVVRESDTSETPPQKDVSPGKEDSAVEATPDLEGPSPDEGLATDEQPIVETENTAEVPLESKASILDGETKDEKVEVAAEHRDESVPLPNSSVAQAAPEPAVEEIPENQSNIGDSKEQVENPMAAESVAVKKDDSQEPQVQAPQPEVAEEALSATEIEGRETDNAGQEDAKPAEDPTSERPEQVGSKTEIDKKEASRGERPNEATESKEPVAPQEQTDEATESKESMEPTSCPKETPEAGKGVSSSDAKEETSTQVGQNSTPGVKDMVAESQKPNDVLIEPIKSEDVSANKIVDEASTIPKAAAAGEPGVATGPEATKETSEPATVTESISGEPLEQGGAVHTASDAEETAPEMVKEGPESDAGDPVLVVVSNTKEGPEIAKDMLGPPKQEPVSVDTSTTTAEKEVPLQGETLKDEEAAVEPVVQVKEDASKDTPSQATTPPEGKVEDLGEAPIERVAEAPTRALTKPTEEQSTKLAAKERIERVERKIKMYQYKVDDECKDTVGPIPSEEMAAKRASKGEDQSFPSSVGDSSGVIANDFCDYTPELVPGNVLSVEVEEEGEKELGKDRQEDESAVGAQASLPPQSDEPQEDISVSPVKEDKNTKLSDEPEGFLGPPKDVSPDVVEGPTGDTARDISQSVSPGEDVAQSIHALTGDTSTATKNEEGPALDNLEGAVDRSDIVADDAQPQLQNTLTKNTGDSVTTDDAKTELQREVSMPEVTKEPQVQVDEATTQTPKISVPTQKMEAIADDESQVPKEMEILPTTTIGVDGMSPTHLQDDAAMKDQSLEEHPVRIVEDTPEDIEVPGKTLDLGNKEDLVDAIVEEPSEEAVSDKTLGLSATTTIATQEPEALPPEQGSELEDLSGLILDPLNVTNEEDDPVKESDLGSKEDTCGTLHEAISESPVDDNKVDEISSGVIAESLHRDSEPNNQNAQAGLYEPEEPPGKLEIATDPNSIQTPEAHPEPEEKHPPESKAVEDQPSREEPVAAEEPLELESGIMVYDKSEVVLGEAPLDEASVIPDKLLSPAAVEPEQRQLDAPERASVQEEEEQSTPRFIECDSEEQPQRPTEGESVHDEVIPTPEARISPTEEVEVPEAHSNEGRYEPNQESKEALAGPAGEAAALELRLNEAPDVDGSGEPVQEPTEIHFNEEPVVQVSDEVTRAPLVDAHNELGKSTEESTSKLKFRAEQRSTEEPIEELVEEPVQEPASAEMLETSKPAELERQVSREPPSNEVIPVGQFTAAEGSEVVDKISTIDNATESPELEALSTEEPATGVLQTIEEEPSIVPSPAADGSRGVGETDPSNDYESEVITSPSLGEDDDFIFVERSAGDVLSKPIPEYAKPVLAALEGPLPSIAEEETPLHTPTDQEIPAPEGSRASQVPEEKLVGPEVNEPTKGLVVERVISGGHEMSHDLPISTLEVPDSPVDVDITRSEPDSDNNSEGSYVSVLQTGNVIKQGIDQTDDYDKVPARDVQGSERPIPTDIPDEEPIQPGAEYLPNEEAGPKAVSDKLAKDHDNGSESEEETRSAIVISGIAGAAGVAAGNALVARNSSSDQIIPKSAQPSSLAQTMASKDVAEPKEGHRPDKTHVAAARSTASETSREVTGSSVETPDTGTAENIDQSYPVEMQDNPIDHAAISSGAEKADQKLRPGTSESLELVASNTPLSEPFTVIDARPIQTKRSNNQFFPDLVHSGTQTDENLDFASLWDRNLQCFFDLANLEPRSTTPGIVLPDLLDKRAKTLGRAKSVKKQRRHSYKRAEATVAAAVIIYAASQELSPRKSESSQAEMDDGENLKTSQEPQESQIVPPGVTRNRSIGRKEVSIADLSTDESSRSHHSDRHHRHRHHHHHHHSSQSRDGDDGDYDHHHRRHRHRRHRSGYVPTESYSDNSVPRKQDSDFSVDSSRGHPRRRHRTAEEQAAHEKRKANQRAYESYEMESAARSKPREAPPSERHSHHGSTRSSRSYSESHPSVKTEAPPLSPAKNLFDIKGHSASESKSAPRPTSRDVSSRDAPKVEPSRHSTQTKRPRRNSMDVRNNVDIRDSAELSRSKSYRRHREDDDAPRRHRRDEPKTDYSATAAGPASPSKSTHETREELRHHTSRREERQRVRETGSQKKPSGFRAALKKIFA